MSSLVWCCERLASCSWVARRRRPSCSDEGPGTAPHWLQPLQPEQTRLLLAEPIREETSSIIYRHHGLRQFKPIRVALKQSVTTRKSLSQR